MVSTMKLACKCKGANPRIYLQTQVPSLVESVKESGLLLGLFGNSAQALAHVDAWTPREGVLLAKARENDYL
jgi:hypothetical protein